MTVGAGEVFARTAQRTLGAAAHEAGDFFQNMWRSGRGLMNSWGESGKALAGAMDKSDFGAKLRAGADFAKVEGMLKPLNNTERAHVWDILEGSNIKGEAVQAAHKDYHAIAGQIREIYDSYAEDAIDLGLDMYSGSKYRSALNKAMAGKIPGVSEGDYASATKYAMQEARTQFMPKENYLPHYFDPAEVTMFMKEGPTKERILNAIQSQGLATNRREAERFMLDLLERPGEFRGGPLQHTRDSLFNVGYSRDLLKVSKRYFTTAARRLEQARTFGPTDDIATGLMDKMIQEGVPEDRRRMAAKLFTAWAGTRDPKYQNLQRVMNVVHGMTLLSTAGIIQPAQIANTIGRVGWVNTIKSIAALTKEWVTQKGGYREWAETTGATIDSVRSDMAVSSIEDLSQVWVKIIGMEKLDRVNRLVSAVAGRFYAEGLGRNMMKEGADAAFHRRMFQRMGMDADEIFAQGGKLTNDQLRMAGLRVSSDSQFASSVLDLPPFRNTPEGRFMYLFKSFGLQQTQFIKREILDEGTKHGNFMPLLQYTSALGVTAPLLGNLLRTVKGREEPDEWWQTHVENIAYVGAFGAFYDGVRAIGSGPSSLLYWVLGPTASETAQVVGADLPPLLPEALGGGGGDPEPLLKHMIRRTPLIGQYIYNAWYK